MKETGRYLAQQISRRDFVRSSAGAAAIATVSSVFPGYAAKASSLGLSHYTKATGVATTADTVSSARMEALVLRAVEAARAAGAHYAEARVTRTVNQSLGETGLGGDYESLTIGVRALVGGAWGFAASPYWDLEEAAILASEAVDQARINASVFPREVDLGHYPTVKGAWATPIRIDPFTISIEEKIDFFASFEGLLPRHVRGRRYEISFGPNTYVSRQERTVANSEGSLFSQTLFKGRSDPKVIVRAKSPKGVGENADAKGRGMEEAGAGWELFLDANLPEQIPSLIEEAEAKLFLPRKPVEVGRYEMVISAPVIGSLIAATLSDATQLDRAMGFEANAGGTSYLGPDPMTHLGTNLGSPLFSVSGDRSMDKGLATVKWDDEGVTPEPFPIVSRGELVDYQTTREQPSWISSWYSSHGRQPMSHGCSVAPDADNFPLQHTPNLIMTPGAGDASFGSMIENTEKGIAVFEGRAGTDFQSLAGSMGAIMREVVNGKLGPVLEGGEVLFTSRELWKNLLEVGGKESGELGRSVSLKGEPRQISLYSIVAYPARMKEMALVDLRAAR